MMKNGLNDVLPEALLKDVTAEDLNLLMNGSPVVDVDVLKKITSFTDESRECHMTSMLTDIVSSCSFISTVSIRLQINICTLQLTFYVHAKYWILTS